MPVAEGRRRNLSPSVFFPPPEDLSRRKRLKKALKNWLNGLPVEPTEDTLLDEPNQATAPSQTQSNAGVKKKRKRDKILNRFRKKKVVDEEQNSGAVVVVPENVEQITIVDDAELEKAAKDAQNNDRPPIRVIDLPAPHTGRHHFAWMHPHAHFKPNGKDDIDPYGVTNRIKTAKYSLLTFIPKNLFEQFRRAANCYFLFIVILQAIPVISNYNVGLAATPLIIIIGITAVKDALEDYKRYKQDQAVNYALCKVLHTPDVVPVDDDAERRNHWAYRWLDKMRGKRPKYESDSSTNLPVTKHDWKSKYWQDVRVGDIVYLKNNEMIPADICILSTSEPDCVCYVETKNLDGETNLKVKSGPQETVWIQSADDAADLAGRLEVELPSSSLYSFFGRLIMAQKCCSKNVAAGDDDGSVGEDGGFVDVDEHNVIPVSTGNLLLRGCILRNTGHVIGVVVYTGPDTKLIRNSGGTPSKRSRIERQMNPQIILNFILLFVVCLVCAIVQSALAGGMMANAPYWVSSFQDSGSYSSSLAGFLTFWSSVILFQTLVPISLYLTVELCKTCQAFLIHSDLEMWHRETDTVCVPRAWNLSDDLGQIEYLFSDKTGTLTRNIMEFRKISVGGKVYGKMKDEVGSEAVLAQMEEEMGRKLGEMVSYRYVPPSKQAFIDPALIDELRAGGPQGAAIEDFFTLLIVCHTVLVEKPADAKGDDGPVEDAPHRLLFKAQSPDEAALVETSRDLGFVFLGRDAEIVRIMIHGQEERISVLHVLEFNSTRKRMSIIVRRADGRIQLLTKGADNVIYDRLSPSEASSMLGRLTEEHLESFAEEGLRTLCLAWRNLGEREYANWLVAYTEASSAVHDRDVLVDALCDGLEKDLLLLGATAIEDQLQEGVPESIEKLQQGGIKIWVLTGDKLETAINIGFSCKLLRREMLLLTVRSSDGETTRDQLRSAYEQIWRQYFAFGGRQEGSSNGGVEECRQEFALIIEGSSLKYALEKGCRKLFLDLASKCTAVICCRVSPLQKAQVVELVRRGRNAMTLAIGDGANDVSMIQAADIGVGISGQEGMQAVMASDYSISQFRFLTRLLLVHGRWSYLRTAEATLLSFHKNIQFVILLFWYQFYCGFTAEYVYDYMYLLFFNLALTIFPLLALGCFDQDLPARILVSVPPIYSAGIRQESYSMQLFGWYVLDAVYQSLVCFFIPLAAYADVGLTTAGFGENKAYLGNVMALSVIISSNLTMAFNTQSWTIFTWAALPLALLTPILLLTIYSLIPSQDLYGTWRCFLEPLFWATLTITVVISLAPRLLIRYIRTQTCPSDVDVCREVAKYGGRVGEAKLAQTVVKSTTATGQAEISQVPVAQPAKLIHRQASKELVLPQPGGLADEGDGPASHGLSRTRSSFFAESLRRGLVPLSRRSAQLRVFNLRTGRFERINGFAYSQDEGMRGLIEGTARSPLHPSAGDNKMPRAPPAAQKRS